MQNNIGNIHDTLERRTEINKDTFCFEYQGALNTSGYGQITYYGKLTTVHRLAYQLLKGPIKDGHVIMHTCDNPKCWHPAHLVQGTQHENIRDAMKKGRMRFHFQHKV